MEDLTKEFIAESEEGLDRMERCLTLLEARPEDPEPLDEIFRAVHSIKGMTGFLGYGRLESLAHVGESLLGLVRDGRVAVTSELISCLLELLDGLRRIVRLIDETGSEGRRTEDDDWALIAMLGRLGSRSNLNRDDVSRMVAGSVAEGREQGWPERAAPSASPRLPPVPTHPESEGEVTLAAVEGGGASERTLRVDVEVLNRMMNLVGELVLTRNQILQSSLDTQGFAQAGRRLNAVTTELRETVTQARMQPVGNIFGKLPRLVRDLAKACGKKVRIEFAGQETGLDKSLLEAIKDPLTHALRNALDHGIEQPEVRLAEGKQAEGVVRLSAFHQGGAVVIELSDDGAGIAVERVRAKAVERRLVTQEQASTMSNKDVVQMIFLPGFSTAAEVTNVSGRGVGMDVVRANVEKIGGSVELETHPGRGTKLRLRVPLTLAIVPALIVMSGGQSFALPQNTLVEFVYIGQDEVRGAIERIGHAELYRLRGRLLPIVRLDRLLALRTCQDDAERPPMDEGGRAFFLAVIEMDGCQFGLMVDDLLAPEEIVVKPLSRVLREIGIFSGATVLGNGTLALILDMAAIAARAGVSKVAAEMKGEQAQQQMAVETHESRRFLLFRKDRSTQAERSAIALEQVERIERVAVERVECVGGSPVLQYRGRPLPLEDTAALLASAEETVTVLICTRPGVPGRIGLLVAEVFQVVTGTLMPRTEGVFGAPLALLEGRLIAVEELRHTEQELSPSWEAAGKVA